MFRRLERRNIRYVSTCRGFENAKMFRRVPVWHRTGMFRRLLVSSQILQECFDGYAVPQNVSTARVFEECFYVSAFSAPAEGQ